MNKDKFVMISFVSITLLLLAAGVFGTLMLLSIINDSNLYSVLFMICIGWVLDFFAWNILVRMIVDD